MAFSMYEQYRAPSIGRTLVDRQQANLAGVVQSDARRAPGALNAKSSADLPCELHLSMDLEDVFLHFFKSFETLPSPRSVAEARITTDELEGLKLWFSERWGMPRMWCEDPFQIGLPNQILASRQEMFGALLSHSRIGGVPREFKRTGSVARCDRCSQGRHP